jgi:hypothetical protein
MATAIAKPAKLSEALIDEYFAEEKKVADAKAALKPLTDKANSLYAQIETAFLQCGKDKKKVGRFILSQLKKRGNVPWKAELTKRLSSDELKAIEAAVPEKVEVEIKEA